MPRPRPRAVFVAFPRSALARSIPERFEVHVDADPARTAVVAGAVPWSYGALDMAANRVAHALLARPSIGGRPVVLLIEQGAPLVAAILGVLKAGAIYVPLETAHAAAHVAAVWERGRARADPRRHRGRRGRRARRDGGASGVGAARGRDPRAPRALGCRAPHERPGIRIGPEAPASLYYASGSTGRPKGVVGCHGNVLHDVARYTNTLCIDREDRLTLLQSPGFSGAVASLFGALLNGAASVYRRGRTSAVNRSSCASWSSPAKRTQRSVTPAAA